MKPAGTTGTTGTTGKVKEQTKQGLKVDHAKAGQAGKAQKAEVKEKRDLEKITFYVPQALYKRLKIYAVHNDRTITELITTIFAEWLKRNE